MRLYSGTVGVNGCDTAAHVVVIKGVHTWHNNASQEYSDLDVMQMLGRAVNLLSSVHRVLSCNNHIC
jgi:hypothetical protein